MAANSGQGSIGFGGITQSAPVVLPGASQGIRYNAGANEYRLGSSSPGLAQFTNDRYIVPNGNFLRFVDGDFQTYIGSDAVNAQADDPINGTQYLSFLSPSGFNSFQNSAATGNGITAQVSLSEIAGIGLRLGITSPNEPVASDKNIPFLESNFSAIAAGQETNFNFYSGLDNSAPVVANRGGWEFWDGQAVGGSLKSRLISIQRSGKATFYDRAGTTGTNEITFDAVTLKQPAVNNQNLISGTSIVLSDTVTTTTKATLTKNSLIVEAQPGSANTKESTTVSKNAVIAQVGSSSNTTPQITAQVVGGTGRSINMGVIFTGTIGGINIWMTDSIQTGNLNFVNGFGTTIGQNNDRGAYRFYDAIVGSSTNIAELARLKRVGDLNILRRLGVGLSNFSNDPAATIEIVASTGAAGTAPLKLNAGTNLGTPVNGVFEYDGANLYFTTGGVRKTVQLV